ncbi:MAG: DUF1232 domain-containing protein [Chitinophagales bacterium]|nr:DUF1232 domain-containing protein [Chitinophagales bacterium]
MRLKDLTVIVAAFIAFVYLFNPGAGFIEFIPDNFPVIGNLDEAAAVAIIVSAFKYFGINFPDIFKSEERASSKATKKNLKTLP